MQTLEHGIVGGVAPSRGSRTTKGLYRETGAPFPRPSSRSLGCLTGLVGLSLVASGCVTLLITVGAGWGGGSGVFLLVHLVAGSVLGLIGIVLSIIGAERVVEHRPGSQIR